MLVRNILIAAKASVDTPEKWARGWYAMDDSGAHLKATDANATCFCSVGAVIRQTGSALSRSFEEAVGLLSKAAKELYADRSSFESGLPQYGGIARFNDHKDTRHADVMRVFDKAIEYAST